MLKAVAGDAAAAGLRRASLLARAAPETVLSTASGANRTATWSRRELTAFVRGVSALSHQGRVVRLAMLARFVHRWRFNTRPDGDADSSILSTTQSTAQRQSRLNIMYAQEMERQEGLRRDIEQMRWKMIETQAKPEPTVHTRRFLVLHMMSGLRQRLRAGFHRWKLFVQEEHDGLRLARLVLELELSTQTVVSRQGQVAAAAEQSAILTLLLKRAWAFFTWKTHTVQDVLTASRAAAAASRAALSNSLLELKAGVAAGIAKESSALQTALESGADMARKLRDLQTTAKQLGAVRVGRAGAGSVVY